MSPEERMDHMATLDGSVAGPWAGVGRDQLDWLSEDACRLGQIQAGRHLQP